MIVPPSLQKGDKIGIISTARKISSEELKPSIKILKRWGLQVCIAPNLFAEDYQFAGTDDQRLQDIQGYIDNPEIKLILCARGGYGTVRIIDRINFLPLVENPKWIAGYSDVTVLHNHLFNKGIQSLHSSMPINFARTTDTALQSLKDALFGNQLSYRFPAHPFNRNGEAFGKLTGGNLSMLYSQTGSPSALQTEGTILFMEDLDEYLYHIDRMMYNLKRNGYFEKPAAVIVGGMSDMNDNTIPFGETAEEIIHRHLQEYNYPVCFGFPAGHLDDNRTLIIGRKAHLKITATQTQLTFDG